jgi:hypothetical protein
LKENYFDAKISKPYHLSVGAILINKEREVCCHYFKQLGDFQNVFLLMRETLNPNEKIENGIRRGLKEEFNAEAKLITYIGSEVAYDKWFNGKWPWLNFNEPTNFQKTTIFFLLDLVSIDIKNRDKTDDEGFSEILFLSFDDLIQKQKDQLKRYKFNGLGEISVLENAKKYLSKV